LEQSFAKKLMSELKIDVTRLAQEEWEMKILSDLFDSSLGNKLIFKGGTALRLAYNSPRFSEDLDFTAQKPIPYSEFKKAINQIRNKHSELSLADIYSKYYTFFAKLRVNESWLPRNFTIKIEVSKRRGREKSEIKTLSSPTTNIQVIARVQTLKQIEQDKINAAKGRTKPRDFFDLWYLANIQRKPETLPKSALTKSQMKSELRKFLPRKYWDAIEEISKKAAK